MIDIELNQLNAEKFEETKTSKKITPALTKVLLIGGKPSLANLLKKQLVGKRKSGIEFYTSTSLEEGIRVITASEANLVFLDVSLPESGRLEDISQLVQLFPTLFIVAIVPEADLEKGVQALRLGAQDFVTREMLDTSFFERIMRYTHDRNKILKKLVDAQSEAHKAKEAAQVAEESSRLKSNFLASMSHEIRTPLNGILGFTEILLEICSEEEQLKYLNIVNSAGQNLLTIINDILDFAKIESGRMDLEWIDFSLKSLIEGQVALLAKKTSEKGLILESFLDSDVPTDLNGDPARLAQVLLNLLGNAIKFTQEGRITLNVSVQERQEKKSDEVVLLFKVKDTGIGFIQSECDRIFQPYIQADRSISRKFGGTGLGLSICKNLVELMGGTMGVESQEGVGSTFWFTCRFRFPETTNSTNPSPSEF